MKSLLTSLDSRDFQSDQTRLQSPCRDANFGVTWSNILVLNTFHTVTLRIRKLLENYCYLINLVSILSRADVQRHNFRCRKLHVLRQINRPQTYEVEHDVCLYRHEQLSIISITVEMYPKLRIISPRREIYKKNEKAKNRALRYLIAYVRRLM